MTLFALALVLCAAFIHATWNLLAKRSGGGAPFVWLAGSLSAALYAPLALGVVLLQQPELGAVQFLFMSGSALLHTAYFLMLQQGYRVGDLSLVYPLARGTGPMLSTTVAVLVLGERPTPLALAGAALVVGSVFVLTSGPQGLRGGASRWPAIFGVATGSIIACYTLWDKHAVSALLVPPILQDWAANLGRALLLTPSALRSWEEVKLEWRLHRLETVGVALLIPLSYILVLTALVFTPVSYVAPAREISILVGAVLGARFLAEGQVKRRLSAASAMVLGVIALALG
ncbi:MAG: EamA family transporter [Chloroflexi bacterium]|nr:EamA family transporter [Chloroflexota bacterium]